MGLENAGDLKNQAGVEKRGHIGSGCGEMGMNSDNFGAGRKTCPVSFLLLLNSIDSDTIVCLFENNSFALKTYLFPPP